MDVYELEELNKILSEIENRIDNFFDGDDGVPNYGDRGYQKLLENRDEI